MNGVTFRAYVERHLALTLAPGDVVVCDNLQCHKSLGVRAAIEARGGELRLSAVTNAEVRGIPRLSGRWKYSRLQGAAAGLVKVLQDRSPVAAAAAV
jgi:hypothetical protein